MTMQGKRDKGMIRERKGIRVINDHLSERPRG